MKNLVVMLPTLDEEYGLREILPLIPKDELKQIGWQTEVWIPIGWHSINIIHFSTMDFITNNIKKYKF